MLIAFRFMQENYIYSPDDFPLTAHISKNKEYNIEKLKIITSTAIFVAHVNKIGDNQKSSILYVTQSKFARFMRTVFIFPKQICTL